MSTKNKLSLYSFNDIDNDFKFTNPGNAEKVDYKLDPKSDTYDVIAVGTHNTDEIIQSFLDDVDLNKIIERYEAVTGIDPFSIPIKYDDDVEDYTETPTNLASALSLLLKSDANKKILEDAIKEASKNTNNEVETNEITQ